MWDANRQHWRGTRDCAVVALGGRPHGEADPSRLTPLVAGDAAAAAAVVVVARREVDRELPLHSSIRRHLVARGGLSRERNNCSCM